MTNRPNTTRPFSLRLTPEERTRIEREAGGAPLSAYVRERLLGERASSSLAPSESRKALAQILGKLGQSRLAENLGELARLARLGALAVTPETEGKLHAACEEVLAIKRMLMRALG